MSTAAKVVVTILLGAITAAFIYSNALQLSFEVQTGLAFLFGAAFVLHALIGLFRGRISAPRFGLVVRAESEGLFWFLEALYFVLGCVFMGIVFLILAIK